MTLEWHSDSCLCVIEFAHGTFAFIRWNIRCREHTALDGQPLLDAVLALNNGFNNQLTFRGNETPDEKTTEVKRIHDMRATEKDRITRLGPPETR
jgi:hypothetical protein